MCHVCGEVMCYVYGEIIYYVYGEVIVCATICDDYVALSIESAGM